MLKNLNTYIALVEGLLCDELYVRYDKEADVLYVMFDKDSKVYLSQDGDDDVLWEYDINNRLVGVTIMDISTRL